MSRKIGTVVLGLLLLCTAIGRVPAQTQESEELKKAPRVFIDCDFCDMDFIRTEIPFVNYVRDRFEAQVHVLITRQYTGSGGREYTLTFIGRKNFAGKNDTLKYISGKTDTQDEIRRGLVKVLKLGLISYVAHSPLAEKIQIKYLSKRKTAEVVDKWKNWVFSINSNTFASGQKSRKSTSIYGSISASKVTLDWKLRFSFYGSYNENRFEVGSSTIKSFSRGRGFSSLIVKSLGEHFSAGLYGGYSHSTYSNIRHKFYLIPGIEYNIFPYSQSTHRELRLQYGIRTEHVNYLEETIFNKTTESPISHSFSVILTFKQPWGSTETSLTTSQYWHDLSKNRVVLDNELSLRLFGGLSLRVYASVSMIHDQISLPKRGATQEEILLQRKELATTYSYFVSFGISYTFGSIYTNVVNPRFGGFGGGGTRIIIF